MSATTLEINDEYSGLVHQDSEGIQSLSLLVKGIHCALCIQKIEMAVKDSPNIQNVRLNFSTGRLNIQWNGDAAQANDYVQSVEQLGYEVHPFNPELEKASFDHENRFLLLCMGVAGFAMGNIMLLSVGLWSTDAATMGDATRNLLHWVSALIAIPAILFSGRPFFRSALSVLKVGHTNMDVPISLAIILATGMSLFETISHGEHVYFDSAVMLMFFLLIGRYLDFRAKRNARTAATDLMRTLSGFATVIKDNQTQRVLIRDLTEGTDVIVAMGEKIPLDGVVKSGESLVDTSLITGETIPRSVQGGADVYGGTINQSAPLIVTIKNSVDDSVLADIVRIMEDAEHGRAKYMRLADRAARLYTPVVHLMAGLAFLFWWGFMGLSWQPSLLIAVTVLIITCPCALGLAVPVVQVLGTSRLMKRGVLVKSGDAFERFAKIDTVIFDKTGTLTHGKPKLSGQYDEANLKLAASLASHSAHPLSRALADAYSGPIMDFKSFEEVTSKGVQGRRDDQFIQLGSRSWCGDASQPDSNVMELWLAIDKKPVCCFQFEDHLKQDAQDIVQAMSSSHLKTYLLSGDRKTVVQDIADQLGIKEALADLTPVEKHKILEDLQAKGHHVLMVGDGLNDAPVLSAANISMAPGTAIDMAQNAADIIFMGDKLAPVLETYRVSKHTRRLILQNFALAVIYNIIAVPFAFAGLVTPMIAALAMSGSSLIVIANSYRLKVLS